MLTLLALCSEMAPDRFVGPYGIPDPTQVGPEKAKCKANALHAMLSLRPCHHFLKHSDICIYKAKINNLSITNYLLTIQRHLRKGCYTLNSSVP